MDKDKDKGLDKEKRESKDSSDLASIQQAVEKTLDLLRGRL